MLTSLIAAVALTASPLQVQAFTASPEGFLVTSTLVSGEKEAVLIDAQFTRADAHRLVAKVLESKKRLTAILLTHAHPDHVLGAEVLLQAFPEARLLAPPAVKRELAAGGPGKLAYWKPIYGENLAAALPTPVAYEEQALVLEGQRLELIALQAGESEASVAVWIPSARALIAGDAAYHDVHPYLVETNPARRAGWAANVEKLRALKPSIVIAGHQGPTTQPTPEALEQTRRYLQDFDAALRTSKTSEALVKAVGAKHGALQLPIILELSAKAALSSRN